MCEDAEAGGSVPGCEGTAGGDQSFCVEGERDNSNGAAVIGVSVTPSETGSVAGAQQENSSARSLSVVVGAGIASAVVFGLF